MVNLLYILCSILCFSSKFVLSLIWSRGAECWISFGGIHFLGKLIRFMHFYRHYNSNLRFSFILSTKFFVSPRILAVFLGLFTNHSPGHVTMTSQLKWRSTDRLFENHFLSDYSISRFVYAFLFIIL